MISQSSETGPATQDQGRWQIYLQLRGTRIVAAILVLVCAGFGVGLFSLLKLQNPPAPPKHTLVPKDSNAERSESVWLFSPDNKYLISTTYALDKKYSVSVWDVAKKKKVHTADLPRRIRSVSLSARGDLMAVAFGDPLDIIARRNNDDGKPRQVRLYSFPELKEIAKIESDRFIAWADLSPDGKLVATASRADEGLNWEIIVWNIPAGTVKHTLSDALFGRVRFSPDGKKVATSYRRGVGDSPIGVREYDVESGKPIDIVADKMGVNEFEYFPDSKQILVKWTHKVFAYDAGTAKYRTLFGNERRDGNVEHAIISADGKWLVLGLDERDLRGGTPMVPSIVIWDLEAEKVHATWMVSDIGRAMNTMALSADKKTIAIGAGGLYLYDISGK